MMTMLLPISAHSRDIPVRMLKSLMPALVAAMLLTGCATLSYTEPPLTTQLGYTAEVATRYNADNQWWTRYEDPQLNRLVELALQNNVDLRKSAININKALYQARLLGADLVPGFSGSLSGSVRKNVKTGDASIRSFGGELGLSYELDLWQKLADAVSAQEWEHQATIEDLAAVRLTLINNVVDAYFHLAYLNDAIEVTRQNMDNYQKLLSLTATKYALGKVAVIEPTQSRQSLLNAQSTLLDLQTQKNTVEQTLADLLNVRSFETLQLTPVSIQTVQPLTVNLDVPLSVLANRPDLRAAEFRLQKAFKNQEATEKSWLPAITIGAALSSNSDRIGSAFSVPFTGGNIAIQLPFLDWNRIKWNIKLSEAEFEDVRLDLEKTVTTALNEVNAYYAAYRNAQETLANSEQQYANNTKITSYYRERYTLGAEELSFWLNAANTEDQSRLSVLNNRYKVIQNENMLYKAMAGRYESVPAGHASSVSETAVSPSRT